MIHIVVADDHAKVRAGLCALLERHREFHIGGRARYGRELLKVVEEVKPETGKYCS
jgi:DNA-binding NarL/FixJ family response regulator